MNGPGNLSWCSHWKGKLLSLSLGGRLTLIKSILNAILIYRLTIFRIPAKIR
jgi:hypothetical protein